MTKIEILEAIKKEQKTLNAKLQYTDDEVIFFNDFIENNDLMNLNNFDKIDLTNLLIAYVKSVNQEFTLQELQDAVPALKEFIEDLDAKSFGRLCARLEHIATGEHFVKIKEALQDKNNTRKHFSLKRLFSKCSAEEMELALISIFERHNHKIMPFLMLFEKDSNNISEGLTIVNIIKEIIESKEEILEDFNGFAKSMGIRVTQGERTKQVNAVLRDEFKINAIYDELSKISRYREKIAKKDKSTKRTLKRDIMAYNTFAEKFLAALDKDEFVDYRKLIERLPNEEIRLAALKLIYSNNMEHYEQLSTTYNKLAENSVTRYQALLQEYGIPKEKYFDAVIMKNSYADTKFMLEVLRKINITASDKILEVLETSNRTYLENFIVLVEKGIIPSSYIAKHINLLDVTTGSFESISSNLQQLKEKQISPYIFKTSPETITLSKEMFQENINVLDSYQLLPSMSNSTSYDFLGIDKLSDKIDTVLELGCEKFLEEDLSILNYSETRYKRLQILRELNIEISDIDMLKEVLTTDKFLVPDNKLDDYIATTQKIEIPQEPSYQEESTSINSLEENLQEFSNTKRTYNVNGILFSKNKVKKNLKELESSDMGIQEKLKKALTTNTTLNYQSLMKIEEALGITAKKLQK